MQVFNALNGTEVAKKMLTEIQRALAGHPDFQAHLTMPQVEWKWELKAKIYPREPADLGVTIEGEITTEGFDPSTAESRTVVLKGECEVVHPDKVREEIGAPLSSAQPIGRGGYKVANESVEVGQAARGPQVPLLNQGNRSR